MQHEQRRKSLEFNIHDHLWGMTMYDWRWLTHWGRVTHIRVVKLTIIASYNGLSPGRRQAIIWTNAGILLIGPLGTKFNKILIEIHTFSFKKMLLKMSSSKWRPFFLGPNVLRICHGYFSNVCIRNMQGCAAMLSWLQSGTSLTIWQQYE